ncbi:MAG: TetR family transcriptional regulator [Actinomycetota bacterium]|nr:TetR family transcriptional regulator [Actinomycetota bacterium]
MTAAGSQRGLKRSDVTKATILDAARKRFAVDGFQRATIRAIATDASIDPAMVMRYYLNKEGLFAAAVDVDLGLPDLEATDEGGLGELLMRHVLTVWEHPPGNELLLTLLRSSLTDADSADRLRDVFARQVTPLVMRIGDPLDAPRRAGLIASQVLGLALCRHVLKLPPVVAMSEQQLLAEIAPTLQRYLTSSPSG